VLVQMYVFWIPPVLAIAIATCPVLASVSTLATPAA